jgi:hypothetical protein
MRAIEVVPAAPEHIGPIAAAMRPEDVLEVAAAGGETPRGALEDGLRRSEIAETLLVDGRPVAMWGVAPDDERPFGFGQDAGIVWLLATGEVATIPVAFCRAAMEALERHGPKYSALRNAVDARYTTALRWARWLGFRVGPAVPAGVNGEPFHGIAWRHHV